MSESGVGNDRQFERQLRREGERWRSERVGCPHPDLLLARSSEVLDAEVRERVARHLADCAHCSRLARDLEDVRVEDSEPAIEERVLSRVIVRPRVSGGRWIGMVAGIAVALGVTASWWARSVRAPEMTVATTSERAAEPAASANVVPLWSIEPLEVRLPLSSLGPSRGGQEGSDATAPLVDALDAYRRGDYIAAIAGLEKVTRDQPHNADASLYLGVSYVMTGRAADAVAPLERALERAAADRKPEIAWYLATAEQRAGRDQASRARLAVLCSEGSPFQSRACAARAALK